MARMLTMVLTVCLATGVGVATGREGEGEDSIGRVSASQKGSILVFPKVELRWDASGNLKQDTFLDLTNDHYQDVFVQMYFVNGDPELEAVYEDGELVERYHPGRNWVDNMIIMTGNEPTYWSVLTGRPKVVSPFTMLDPDPGDAPGRPALDESGDRVLRGFVLAWAVNQFGEEIRWNHLKGDALIIDYLTGAAWEYNAYAFQAIYEEGDPEVPANGETTGTPGELNLNGTEFDACFEYLLLDFYASHSMALTGSSDTDVEVDTDLTLLPMKLDLRQEHDPPVTTKANAYIWNMNETGFSGTHRCVTFWDQEMLSHWTASGNHFLVANLQTDKGKAWIWDKADYCPGAVKAPLLGVAAKHLTFGAADDFGRAGMNLVGMGYHDDGGIIKVDTWEAPPELLSQMNKGPHGSANSSKR